MIEQQTSQVQMKLPMPRRAMLSRQLRQYRRHLLVVFACLQVVMKHRIRSK